ncbi:tetratricopeptide repeat protein [Chondromyces apiculatus]|nr:tetratricopeptide repeat protein [Chondromyces apiculatus]
MSVETIRMALGRLQDEPENDAAWKELEDAVTAPGVSETDVERLLGAARGKHEQRREWGAVARLLELEIALSSGGAVEAPMQAELARIYSDELIDVDRASNAYRKLLELRPGDAGATEALEDFEVKREKWRELTARYVSEAEAATDDAFKSVLYTSAADVAYRYGREEAAEEVLRHLDEALRLDRKNRRAAALAELAFSAASDWEAVARVQQTVLTESPQKDDRVAAGLRAGRTLAQPLKDQDRAITVYKQVLDLAPGQPEAMSFLAEAYSAASDWDRLVALYEDQLRGGGVKAGEELGMLVQIAMVHWRMREQPDAAEPYFDRVRRTDPTHEGMLTFFRELCTARGDTGRLSTILTDAQRAMPEGAQRRTLATEIARLVESNESAAKAIEQYKAVLRADPESREARDALKRLYLQTEGYNPLVELYRWDLERTPAEDAEGRAAVLREIATVYRDRTRNDAALVTVLTQLVQLDDKDIEAVRELTRIYESLGRWRDLLQYQQRLAELSHVPAEKANLYRAVARRWIDQFSNVQNAITAYEALLQVEGTDEEAQQKLRELYLKRRAWPQLYTLYERQLSVAAGAERVELLGEMAKLAAERLDRGADAIALQKQILEIEPGTAGVLDALEKLAEREKDFGTVAEVLERRVDLATDDAGRLAALQKLGAVYAERLKDGAAAARTWRRVLALSPGHARALRVLRDTYFTVGDWDGLEELYASQRDWEGLVDFLSTAADKAPDPQTKLDISFRAARIFEEELRAPERAARSYERVLTVSARDPRAAAALVPIYEKEEKWSRLPALYEILLDTTEDVGTKVEILRKLAAVTGEPLSDKVSAVGYARRAYELQPDEEGLGLLEAWSRAASSWGPFVQAVEGRLKQAEDLAPDAKRSLQLKLAEVYAREMGKLDEAVHVYRALVEEDPTDVDTVQALDELLRASARKDDLRWLFALRAGQVEGEERAEILEEWATLEEEVFGDASKAIELLRQVTDLVPGRSESLRALSRLLTAAGEFEAAAEVVAVHRDASEGEERARREIELAGLYLDRLGRPVDSFHACVRALEIEAHDSDAIAILGRLMERPETRARAAEVLSTEYAEIGDPRREAMALRVLLEGEPDAERRRELYLRLAIVEESKLRAAGTAFDVLLRALHEFSDDLVLWDRAAELAQRAGRPTDLAEAYRLHLVAGRTEGDKVLGSAIEVELCERAASLHDEQLGDPEGAMPYLERVLAVDPNNSRAFSRLKQILTNSERWGELEDLYDKAAKATTDQQDRIELLNEVALIAEEIIGDASKAIGYYERVLALDTFHVPSLDALEKLYEREGRWQDLAALLERRLATATDEEGVDIKLHLGRIYLDRLLQPELALTHLEDVLRLRQNDAEARSLVERVLEIGSLRLRSARVLEVVYEARDEIRQLVRVLEIRREGATDEQERRELLRRISVLRDERLRDDAGAFSTLSELVPLEPEDPAARSRLLEIGRRLGSHEQVASVLTAAGDACTTPVTQGEILMEVARIYEDLLDDANRAEQVYRRVLGIDANDPQLVIPAAQALGRIYASREQHQALAEVLGIEVRLEDDADTRRALYERIGILYDTVLDDPTKAIEAWRARLSDDPTDVSALSALERLYERTSQWRELVGILRAREQSTEDSAERRRAMTKAAETLAHKLADVPEAINAWRAVLDEFGPERSTLASLETLYELDERWVELADALDVDLSLTDDTKLRLALLAQLGDVRRLHQDDAQGALDAYRQALSLDRADTRSRKALEAMLEREDARRDAAETLEPLYEDDGDAERLLRVLEIKVETGTEASERLSTLHKALRTAEGPLGDTSRAFSYALRGLKEGAGEPEVSSWIDTVERLGETTGRWAEVCALFQEIAPDILDGDVQQNVRLRVGELARHKLSDRERAITQYRKALESRGDDRRAMIALEELYGEADDAVNLLEILKLRVENAQNNDEKTKLLFRVADLQRGPLGDKEGAISTYEEILDITLEVAAIKALDALYREASRYEDLIRLYERQLDSGAGPAEMAELHVKIALVAHQHTGDVQRAFDELSEALLIEQSHVGAVTLLESILENATDPEHKARAGEMLESVYLRRADWSRVKVALDARLSASQEPAERRDLLQRLATLHEEQLEDYRSALETVAKLLHEDLTDEGVWAELERLAKVASAERRLAEIYAAELNELSGDDDSSAKLCRRTGEIYAELGEVTEALRWYRRAHEFSPESRELFLAIDGLLKKERRHGERIELYRASLDHRDGKDRLDALHTIAELERRELGQPAAAIDTYRAALDVDDGDTRSLDALTELYRELDRPRDLADLYLRRAEAAPDGEQAAPFRLSLAEILRTRLDDTSGAIDQLEAIVTEVPWHTEAIKALEALVGDAEHKARVVEILRPLYERSDDWRHLIRLNEERFSLASDPQEKVAVLRETAKLWETRGGDELKAIQALRAAFRIDPDDSETRAELTRIASDLGAWEELAESLEQGTLATSDDLTRRELLTSLAEIYDRQIDDPRRALRAYERLSALDPSDPQPLEAMDTLAVLLSDWGTLIGVLEKKSGMASDEENASIWRRIAETKLDMIEDSDGAISAYERALEFDAQSTMTIDALINLYEPRENAQRLVELYAQRVELTEPDEADLRYDLNVSAAERYEKALQSPRDAINALNAALEARAGDRAVLKALERLYRSEQMWDELLENLKQQAAAAEDTASRVALRTAIGDLYAKELQSPSDAIEQYQLVLGEDPSSDHAIKAVRAIGEAQDELRLDAANVLEPVLRNAGRYEELAAALELRLRAQTEPTDRATTLRAIALVQDEQLKRPLEAEAALLRALEDTPEDVTLHEDIERIAERTEGFGRYCDALAQRAGAIFDATVAKDLWLRVGRIAEEKLKDDRRSVEAYAKAVEHAGDEPALLEALDRLYGRLGDTKALADVLERRVAVTPDERHQAELFYRLAVIQIESFDDKSQGLATLRQALERAVDHEKASAALEKLTDSPELFEEAAEALEGVYRTRNDNPSLARLYEKRIRLAATGAERVRMRLDLAKVLEERASDARAAQETLEKALADEPSDADVLAELERLAPMTGGWQSAAAALEKAVREATDLDGDTARDLWMRIAEWQKDKVGDPRAAERAFEEALKHDATSEHILRSIEQIQRTSGRELDLVATLRRLAALDGMDGQASEIRREAKALAEGPLNDKVLVEAILREMIAADDGDAWALSELTKVREAASDWKEVYALLVRQAELAADAEVIREKRHAAAAVARERLGEHAGAIELYETIFEDEPSDERAAKALRELYAATGKYKELLKLLERLTDLAESSQARSALRLESAEICLSRLDAVGEATEHLRAVLDEEPENDKATALLAQLLEKTGRDQELSDLFVRQIDLAKERNDVAAELLYSVRLGEVYEKRLNDTARAIESYRAVLAREPRHKEALLSLARLYEQKGDKAAAAEQLEVVLADTSGQDAVTTALRLADLHRALSDEAAVRRVLERGLSADQSAAEIRKRLLSLYEKQEAWTELAELITGDADTATEATQKVNLYRKAAQIHMEKRSDPGRSAELLEKASDLQKGDRELLLALCDAYSASGRGQKAAEALQKIIESYGGRRSKELAAIHHRLSKAYLADGQQEKALAELETAFKIDPGSIAVLRELGVLSLQMSSTSEDKVKDAHLDRAQKTFRALLLQKLDDTAPITKAEVFYYLGEISHRQSDDKKAIQMLERALDSNKDLAVAKELMAKLKK